MSKATQPQLIQFIRLLTDHCPERDRQQALIDSGLLPQLFAANLAHVDRDAFQASLVGKVVRVAEPTIKPITVLFDYTRTLLDMRKADECLNWHPHIQADDFPVEVSQNGERALVLICFHREIKDDEDPEKSELLRELDKLGLKPEGLFELCVVGVQHPDLLWECTIAARRQICRHPVVGFPLAPVLNMDAHGIKRCLNLHSADSRGWGDDIWFLASYK